MSATHHAARAYAAKGIAVFPIVASGEFKMPATENGLLDATVDIETIDRWFTDRPNQNVGIATGAAATFWVMDVDGPEGAASLAAMEAEHGALPETPEQKTARGRHICFAYDAERPIRNSQSRHPRHIEKYGPDPRAKIDVRGDGGYIVAAPSMHKSGFQYQWHPDRRPSRMAFAPAPDWLREILEWKPPAAAGKPVLTVVPKATVAPGSRLITPYGESALRDEVEKIRTSIPGNRNATINTGAFVIGQLVAGGEINESMARAALLDAAMVVSDKPIQYEAEHIERSLSDGMKTPRTAPEPTRRSSAPQRPAPAAISTQQEAPSPIDEADVRRRMSALPIPVAGEQSVIQIRGGGLSEEATLSEAAIIAADMSIYQRGDALNRPVVEEVAATHDRKTHIARLVAVDQHHLTDCMCQAAVYEKYDGRSESYKRVNPPPELARIILARQGTWKFPRIAGVITTPTLRPDGSLLAEPGYDAATRLLLIEPPSLPPIPDRPSQDQALESLRRLSNLLTEFPFVSGASHSVAISALITPVVRAAFTVSPMHVVKASTPGSGKSFLLDVAAAIAIGRPMPVMSAGRTEEEFEKRLGAALLAGQPLISVDNVNADLGGDALCQIVERPIVDIRILGKSERVSVEARSTLFATGNNIRLIGDMTRRVIVCGLDANMERPEGRHFSGNPVSTVLADRGRYIADALIVCRAYIAAGRPSEAPPLGSFEGWSNLVRSALIWLGEADPVETMAAAREEDPFVQAMRAVYSAIAAAAGQNKPLTTAEFIKLASEKVTRMSGDGNYNEAPEQEWRHPDLREALLTVAGKNGFIDPRFLGKWFGRHKGRIASNLRLDGVANEKSARWWITSAVTAV